jgi:hypothetical protein
MVEQLFDTSGNYRGFLDGENIYNTDGRFVGFIDSDGDVYTSNGDFVGIIIDNCVAEDPTRSKIPKGARFAPAREPTMAAPIKAKLLSSRFNDGFDLLEKR